MLHVPRPPPSTAAPSTVLLSLLASITPTAAARPSPDFLCPTFTTAVPPSRRRSRRPRAEGNERTPSSSSASVPVKYEQSHDGLWYPAKSWSLHGRSKMQMSGPLATPTPIPNLTLPLPTTDEDDNDGVLTASAIATSTTAVNTDIANSLPTGWQPPPMHTKFYDESVIIVVSLLLAIVVTLVIAGCVLCHKNRSAAHDIERAKRAGQTLDDEDDDDDVDTVDPDSPQITHTTKSSTAVKKDKMWERWRRQAKIGLKRRRRWRHASAHSPVDETADQPPPPDHAPHAQPLVSSPPPQLVQDPQPHPVPPPPPPLPPAYRRISCAPRTGGKGVDRRADESDAVPASPDEEGSEGAGVPVRAHVATDDKAVLERMRREASEPSENRDVQEVRNESTVSADTGAEEMFPRAPLWVDERLEDFEALEEEEAGPSSRPTRDSTLAHPSPLRLPPPPRPTQAYRVHHSGEDVGVDSDSDELAFGTGLPFYVPRFEVGPSAPPTLVEAGLEASAPPLGASVPVFEGMVASAPAFEGMVASSPAFEGMVANAPVFEEEKAEGEAVVGKGDDESPSAARQGVDAGCGTPGVEVGGEGGVAVSRPGHVPWSPPLSSQRTTPPPRARSPTRPGVDVNTSASLPRYEP